MFKLSVPVVVGALFFSLPGSAFAQEELIQEYLADVGALIAETLDDIDEELRDLEDCFDDLEGGLRRADNASEQVDALGEFVRCLQRNGRQLQRICRRYRYDLEDIQEAFKEDAEAAGVSVEVASDVRVQEEFIAGADLLFFCAGG